MYDRYWRLRVVGALVCIAAALALAAWYIAYVLPIDLRAGKVAFTGIMAAIDVVFVLLGIAVYQPLAAAPERRRQRLREEAMAGNQDAIPLARPLPNADSNQPKSDEPFEISFSTTFQQWRALVILLVGALGIVALGIAVVLQNVNVRRLGDALMCPVGRESTCAQYFIALMFLSLVFAIPFILISMSGIVETLRSISITPVQLTIRTNGVVRRTLTGRSTLIPWSEMRLLEVRHAILPISNQRVMHRQYLCYTRRGQFSWAHEEGASFTNPLVRLGAAVTDGAGLLQLTFDPLLFVSARANPPPGFEPGRRASARFALIMSGLVVLIGAVAFLPVLTPRYLPAWFICLLLIVVLLSAFMLSSLHQSELDASEQDNVVLVAAASSSEITLDIDPLALYEMTVGSYPAFVINQVMSAGLGLAMTLFGLALLASEFVGIPPNKYGRPWLPYSPLATVIVVGVIALGLVIFLVAVRARDTVMLAEISGVRKRWLLGNVFIPWERVEHVERKRYWGAPGYRIVSGAPRKVIQWPIQPFQPSRKAQELGAVLVTPDQMAQIVAQRSGRPIREVRRLRPAPAVQA